LDQQAEYSKSIKSEISEQSMDSEKNIDISYNSHILDQQAEYSKSIKSEISEQSMDYESDDKKELNLSAENMADEVEFIQKMQKESEVVSIDEFVVGNITNNISSFSYENTYFVNQL